MGTEYTGNVPQGGEKVTDFVVKLSGEPHEPNDVEVQFRDGAGVVIETDTLSGAGVYRPTGSTGDNDPGHFRAKWIVPNDQALATNYTVYARWQNAALEWGPYNLVETFEVQDSVQTIVVGAPYLATEDEVRAFLEDIAETPVGDARLSSPRLQRFLVDAHNLVLAEYRVAKLGDLTDQQRSIGRSACIKHTVADLLVALNPKNEWTLKSAKQLHHEATVQVAAGRELSSKTKQRRGPSMRGTR